MFLLIFSPSSIPSWKVTKFGNSQETRGHLIRVDAWTEVTQDHAESRRDTSDQIQCSDNRGRKDDISRQLTYNLQTSDCYNNP